MRQTCFKTNRLGVLALLMLIAVIGSRTSVLGQDDENAAAQARGIVGAWGTVVTPRNCVTGVPAPFTIRGLFTFHSGGTMSEWGVGPGSSPALRGPGHGTWKGERGWDGYAFTFTHYLYDVAGIYTGRQIIVGSLVYDAGGDAFTTTSSVEVRNVADTVVAGFCATAIGTRIE